MTCYHNTCTQTRTNAHFCLWLGDRLPSAFLLPIISHLHTQTPFPSNDIPLGCQWCTLKAGCDMMIKNPTLTRSLCGSQVYGLGQAGMYHVAPCLGRCSGYGFGLFHFFLLFISPVFSAVWRLTILIPFLSNSSRTFVCIDTCIILFFTTPFRIQTNTFSAWYHFVLFQQLWGEWLEY